VGGKIAKNSCPIVEEYVGPPGTGLSLTPTSWESSEDLALEREEMFVNKVVEVVLVRPELGGQVD
jgi:hypothetical protein